MDSPADAKGGVNPERGQLSCGGEYVIEVTLHIRYGYHTLIMEGRMPLTSCIVQASYDGYSRYLKCEVGALDTKGGDSGEVFGSVRNKH